MKSTTGQILNGGSCAGASQASAFGLVRAFSLVEVLIVVVLLSVIILGLMAMFGQTQRAFRLGMAQTDVLESGRATTDLLARELQQVTPSYLPGTVNFYSFLPTYAPLYQALPGSTEQRTNILFDLYFLTCENQRWTAKGYFVYSTNSGVGTLYSYTRNAVPKPPTMQLSSTDFLQLFNSFTAATVDPGRLASRVADGVVHFRVRAYDTNGDWITANLTNNFNFSKSDIRWSERVAGEMGLYTFRSNAVPAAVEIELGFLETRTLERAKSIADAAARRSYLSNRVGQVHLFRQRIPIETVDVKAYQ